MQAALPDTGFFVQRDTEHTVSDPADIADPVYKAAGGTELRFHGYHCAAGRVRRSLYCKAMGASNIQIIFRVLLVEAKTSLLTGFTITTGLLLGYSAMSGTVGGGGLGDIAVRYGYYRWQADIMVITVVLLILIFQILQTVGMKISKKLDHRKR